MFHVEHSLPEARPLPGRNPPLSRREKPALTEALCWTFGALLARSPIAFAKLALRGCKAPWRGLLRRGTSFVPCHQGCPAGSGLPAAPVCRARTQMASASAMASAMRITRWSRVFCSTKYSMNPPTFTMPTMWAWPTAGSRLFTPRPGSRGPGRTPICPTCSDFPRQASMATKSASGCARSTSSMTLARFPACTGYAKVPYTATFSDCKPWILVPMSGPRASPVDRSVPIHMKTAGRPWPTGDRHSSSAAATS